MSPAFLTTSEESAALLLDGCRLEALRPFRLIRDDAGEALREPVDALGDGRPGLLEHDGTPLVQRHRNEAARRDHRVDLDLHHALDVAGVEADLAVGSVEDDAEPLARQPDRQ